MKQDSIKEGSAKEYPIKSKMETIKSLIAGRQANKFKIGVYVLGAVLIALVSFAGGIEVGIHKARFSGKFSDNYEKNFMGRDRHPFSSNFPGSDFFPGQGGESGDFEGRGFRNAHGVSGKIVSVSDNNIVVVDQDGKENTVTVTDKTFIKYHQDDLKITDLKAGDQIVVIGSPGDNGTVNADLIRVFDNARN